MAVISAPLNSGVLPGRGSWRDLDWTLLLVIIALSLWSVLTILSATRPRDDIFEARPPAIAGTAPGARATQSTLSAATGGGRLSGALKQGVWICAGLSLLILLALVDFQLLMHLQTWIYVANLGLLALVLVIGREINGAKSWIPIGPFALQPAEFCKFAMIVALAAFLCRRQERIRDFSTLLWSLAFLAPPLLLILKQPDFGTMLTVFSIWFGMLFFGGARLWHLALVVFVGVALFGFAWQSGKLKPHQKNRLAVFLQQESKLSATREGYQVKQSQIAIGSGQFAGQGYGEGMQNRAGYVPENTTDFIFTVVAEELGFAGGAILIICYLLLLMRSCVLAMSTDNYFGTLIAGGFTALLAFHSIVNLGMTMRVMPITGVPLPFFSYGGSSFLAFSMCAGLLQSIALRRKRGSGF